MFQKSTQIPALTPKSSIIENIVNRKSWNVYIHNTRGRVWF
jgi:hypothetical protein